jgi:putative serine protease PepD
MPDAIARGPAEETALEPSGRDDAASPSGGQHLGGVASTQETPPARRRRGVFVVGLVSAAVLGGLAGGLIVAATMDSSGGTTTVEGQAGAPAQNAAVCQATEVSGKALPSVVTISASGAEGAGTGSGVIIRSGGFILTNDHVISVGAGGGTVSLRYSDGRTAGAAIVGRDPFTDLAVLKADDDAQGLPVIELGQSSSLRVGEPVVALGAPLGLSSTVTTGIVSALDRYVRVPAGNGLTAHLVGAIQTDASINPGNSGGALVDCEARLVGINTAGAAVPNSAGGSIGLGFAIPIDLAKKLADELIETGRVNHPDLGLQVQTIPPEIAQQTGGTAGLFVQGVTPGGSADQAGLRRGDIITEIEGEPATSVEDLVVKTLTLRAGDSIRVTYKRSGTSATTVLTVGPR